MSILRQTWDLEYYDMMLSYLNFLREHENLLQQVQPFYTRSFISSIMHDIQHFAYIHYKEADDENPDVYIRIRDDYNVELSYLLGFYRGHGLYDDVDGEYKSVYDIIDDISHKWSVDLRENARQYGKRKEEKERQLAIEMAERKRLHKEKLALRKKQDDEMKQIIIQYVLDCKSNGDKIVWKSLVRPDFSVNRIARLRKELVDSGLLSV